MVWSEECVQFCNFLVKYIGYCTLKCCGKHLDDAFVNKYISSYEASITISSYHGAAEVSILAS